MLDTIKLIVLILIPFLAMVGFAIIPICIFLSIIGSDLFFLFRDVGIMCSLSAIALSLTKDYVFDFGE